MLSHGSRSSFFRDETLTSDVFDVALVLALASALILAFGFVAARSLT